MPTVNSDDLTGRLIDEGARLLAQQGPAGLSLRKVAAAAGTSTMAVYTRFGDKQHLLAAMRREGFRRLAERMQVSTEDTVDTMTAIGHAYRESALQSPHLYGLMFGPAPADLEVPQADTDAADATYLPMVDNIRKAVAEGILTGDPERIALQLWVVAHGMVSLELSGQLKFLPAETARIYDESLRLAAEPFVAREDEQNDQ